MTKKDSDVIAAEIKIGIAVNSWEELQAYIKKIRGACHGDYTLNINVEGNFFSQPEREPAVEFDGQTAEQYRQSRFVKS